MPRTSRASRSRGGFVYHVVNRGNGRNDVFHQDDDFAAVVNLMREAHDKVPMRMIGYGLHQRLDEIRPDYRYDETCAGSVPQSIIAFLESTSFEEATRNAVSLAGDADTMACIAGGIVEAFYGAIPAEISEKAAEFLEPPLANIVKEFASRFQQGID